MSNVDGSAAGHSVLPRRLRTRTLLFSTLVGLSCGSKQSVPISPDDPSYCTHCPCKPGKVTCPMDDPRLCSLSGLWAWIHAIEDKARTEGLSHVDVEGIWSCKKYIIVETSFPFVIDGHLWEYAYVSVTGAILASREGGGIDWLVCRDGYRANYWTQPPGFIFPERTDCVPMGVPGAVDGGVNKEAGTG